MATNYINRIGTAPVWGRGTAATPTMPTPTDTSGNTMYANTTPTTTAATTGNVPQFSANSPWNNTAQLEAARQMARYWMPSVDWSGDSYAGKSVQDIGQFLRQYANPASTQQSQFQRDLAWYNTPTSWPEWYAQQAGTTPVPPVTPTNPNPQPGTGTTPTPPSTTTPVAAQPDYMQWLQSWLTGGNTQMPTGDGGQQAGNSLGSFLGTFTWAQNSDWFNQPSQRQGAEAWANVMMPYAQLMQNSWQYSQDFNEAQRRFNEQQAWQKAQDAANMQMAQEQLSQNLQSIWGRNQTSNVRWYRNY